MPQDAPALLRPYLASYRRLLEQLANRGRRDSALFSRALEALRRKPPAGSALALEEFEAEALEHLRRAMVEAEREAREQARHNALAIGTELRLRERLAVAKAAFQARLKNSAESLQLLASLLDRPVPTEPSDWAGLPPLHLDRGHMPISDVVKLETLWRELAETAGRIRDLERAVEAVREEGRASALAEQLAEHVRAAAEREMHRLPARLAGLRRAVLAGDIAAAMRLVAAEIADADAEICGTGLTRRVSGSPGRR